MIAIGGKFSINKGANTYPVTGYLVRGNGYLVSKTGKKYFIWRESERYGRKY